MGVPRQSRQSWCCEYIDEIWPADPLSGGDTRRSAALRGALALTEEARQDLVLAVNEAATNAVPHAYAPTRRGTR
jgi:two-component sensor histidine kinase